jgi:hypothetical protein
MERLIMNEEHILLLQTAREIEPRLTDIQEKHLIENYSIQTGPVYESMLNALHRVIGVDIPDKTQYIKLLSCDPIMAALERLEALAKQLEDKKRLKE